jgi:hypothetical protein
MEFFPKKYPSRFVLSQGPGPNQDEELDNKTKQDWAKERTIQRPEHPLGTKQY